MKTQSADTHPKIEEIQIQLIRQASVAKRIERMRSLTKTILELSKNAIAAANPGLSERELDVLFVRNHYGDELADRFQAYLTRKELYGRP